MNNSHPSDHHNPQASSDAVMLPYFDFLLASLAEGNAAVEKSFGRHVHWGYWPTPQHADITDDGFAQAAEELSAQICLAGHVHHGLKLLDVGCGFGGTVAHINEHYVRMALTGLNLDERQLQRARETVVATPQNQVAFQQGDACALPFPDQSFDAVLAVECIFHFPDRQQFFNEAHRVLKPGGYLALSDFIVTPQLQPFSRLGPSQLKFYGRCNLQFTAQHYRQLAAQTQFTVQTERDITQNTLPTYTYLRRLAGGWWPSGRSAMFETLLVEALSRLGLLRYYIYGFQK